MRIQKRAFSLLEVMVALALTSLILVSVLSFFKEISKTNRIAEGVAQESFRLRYLESRLSQIFPTAGSNLSKKDFYFFSTHNPPALTLSYDNGTCKQKELSNTVLGKFFLDPQKRCFYLATWPSPDKWTPGIQPPLKLEILMEDVDEINWEFFVPPDKNWKPKLLGNTSKTGSSKQDPPVKPTVSSGWTAEWRQEYKLLPGLIRLQLKSGGKSSRFIFPLSQTERQIVYTQ